MQVVKVTPRGYCHGVVHAIKLIGELVKDESTPRPIHILGMIVHNKDIIDAFEELGIKTIDGNKTRYDLLDEINEGTVVFTAHGISPYVVDKALEKGLKVVDASCVDVERTQRLVIKHLEDGYSVIYIGKKGHPEPEAITFNTANVHLVENEQDVAELKLNTNKILVTNQTTMSLLDIFKTSEAIKNKFPQAMFVDEICNATRIRQEAAMAVENVDLAIVVGDPKSNNSKKLSEVMNVNSIRIANIHDLDLEVLKDVRVVAVTSGASTPTSVTNQVISFLENFDYSNKATWEKPNKLKAMEILSFIR